jgi:general secretion pathway protein A
MYEAFFGLKEKPFGIVPNPDYLYFSPRHKEALTFLEYGLMDNVGAVLLTGEIGIGKTTLIRYVINNFCTDIITPVIYNTNLSPEQLIETILQSLQLPVEKDSKSHNYETLNQFLLNQLKQEKRVVLTIDEAQNLPPDTLEEVRMLSNLQTDSQMLLQVLLVGQPEFRARIQQPELSQLAQRIAVNFHLEALKQAESLAYIEHRLAVAGRDDSLFSDEALVQIYQASKGIPRNINLICDSALVYGFGYEMQSIGTEVIDQVLADKNKIGLEFIQPTAPQPENGAANGNGFSNGNGTVQYTKNDVKIIKKLKTFEIQFAEFQRRIQRRVNDLSKKVDNIQNELTNSLTELVLTERNRNEELLVQNQKLTSQFEELNNKHRQLIKRLNDDQPFEVKSND